MTGIPVPLQAQALVRRFPRRSGPAVVDGVNLDVRAGAVHALVGLNGAGKTTLLRLLLGLLRPSSGHALVAGVEAWGAPPQTWAGVGHLVDAPFAYPELTVRENVQASARLHGLSRPCADDAAEQLVLALGLTPWADRRARVLSTGNRQRLGLAAALVHRPAVLVLDEPTSALDPSGIVLVRGLLRELADRGAAVLVSSHHLDEVARIADRISVLHDGRVVGTLPPGTVDLERQLFALVEAE